MKGITFCLACGADAPADARRCPSCGAPLGRAEGPAFRSRRPFPFLLLLCALAAIALIVAVVTALVT